MLDINRIREHKEDIATSLLKRMDKKDLDLSVRYENSRVELYYTIKKDRLIELEDKKVHFHNGDQILVSVSYRYSEEELKKVLNIYFDDFKFYFNPDKTWALVLCKK